MLPNHFSMSLRASSFYQHIRDRYAHGMRNEISSSKEERKRQLVLRACKKEEKVPDTREIA
jgi:hypothetical protein